MLPFQSYYDPVQQMKLKLEDGDSGTRVEGKSTAACNSHSEAERRRRQRINAHLSTLRTLLPNTTKVSDAFSLSRRCKANLVARSYIFNYFVLSRQTRRRCWRRWFGTWRSSGSALLTWRGRTETDAAAAVDRSRGRFLERRTRWLWGTTREMRGW